MKKQLLFLMIALLPMMTSAQQTVEIDGIYYKLFSDTNTAEVTHKPSGWYWGSFDIPASVTYEGVEYSVTSIGHSAFKDSSGLTTVTIPNSVTSIGKSAFQDCFYMTSVTIPSSVTSIGESAFSKCYFLTSISIPDGVTSLGYDVFYCCSGLTSITIPPNMTSIGRSTFQYCTGLTTVTIPDGVTSLGENAFRSCTGLTSVTIPGSVSSIGDNAFAYCSELTNMYCYAEQVPETGDRIFYSSNSTNATLHVPAGCIDTYGRAEQWKDFKEIVTLTDSDPNPSGIITPAATKQPAIAKYFDLQGRLLSGKPAKGLFIENGKKVVSH